jgi:MFS family permease
MSLSIGIIAFGLPSPFVGILVNRLGPRLSIIIGNALAGLALMGVSLAGEIWHMYLLYIFLGLGAGLGGYIPSSTVVNNWFIRRRSLALGMFMACGGLGAFAFPPITATLIELIGWRMTYVAIGGGCMFIAVVIGGIGLVRNRPEDMGQLPDGASAATYEQEAELQSKAVEGSRSGGLGELVRHPAIWLIGAFAAANAFALGTMTTHQVAYVQDIGFSPLTAASTQSMMAAMSVIGSLSFGSLALRLNLRYLAIGAFCCQLVAVSLLLTTQELWLIYVYAFFLGIGNGALMTAMPTFVGAIFRRERYSQALGFTFPFHLVSQAVAAYVAGAIFDATSSYRPAFMVLICFMLAGIFFVYMIGRQKRSNV